MPYLTGGISIAVLAVGSTAPGLLQFFINKCAHRQQSWHHVGYIDMRVELFCKAPRKNVSKDMLPYRFSSIYPDYRERVLRHEAAHLLVNNLLYTHG